MATVMYKLWVFAGTSEGRRLLTKLEQLGIASLVSVATEYGQSSLEQLRYSQVEAGRLGLEEIVRRIAEEQLQWIIDCTHPYAREITANLQLACQQTGCRYLRILREQSPLAEGIYFATLDEAIAWLEQTSGPILVTTGSKRLEAFTGLSGYRERIYPRVLPTTEALLACAALNIPVSQIIAVQGPFSVEMNMALLHHVQAAYLVTKESGREGGFAEKIEAAVTCGVIPVIIGRPVEEQGLTLDDCLQQLEQWAAGRKGGAME